ncbi:MAG: iron ABC transporter permease [Verrucomicrobiota bacterium]
MKKFLLPALVVFFGLFLIYPVGNLLIGAFFTETTTESGTTTTFTLEYFSLIFENPFYRECFLNSLLIAIWTTLATLILSVPLAYAFLRYHFPGKQLLSVAILLPLILPPFVGAIGLKQFFARFGSINLFLADLGLVDLQNPPDWFGAGGFTGIILLEVMHLYPIMYLSVQAALANLDPSLRDAAQNMGATGGRIFRTITLPLALPGIFAGSTIVFVSAFTDLGVPLMFDFQTTIPTQIFNLVTQADNPMGYALVVITLVLVSLLFLIGKRIGDGQYAMLARSASYDDTVRLSPAVGWGLFFVVLGWILFTLLPHFGVIIQSFSARWFFTVFPEDMSPEFYSEVFSLDLTSLSVRNSLVYATSSAILDLFLGFGIAYLLARESFKGKNLLDVMAMLPLALPGLVLAFAFYVAFSKPLFPESWASFQTLNEWWLMIFDPRDNPTLLLVIAYAIHRLPYIVRAAYAGFQQTSVSLEEASANMGANPWQTIRKISLPLISANLIAGTILTFSFAMLDVSNGMILAQESQFYPVTKAIYMLMGRITPVAPSIACALGVLSMILLGISLIVASKLLGQKMGQLFKA